MKHTLRIRVPFLLKDRKALESSEFAVLAAAIIVVVYAAFSLLGNNINDLVTRVAGFVQ